MIERGYTDERGRESLVRTMPLRRWQEPLEPFESAPETDVVGRFEGDDDVAPWEIEEAVPAASARAAAPGTRSFQPEAQAEARARALRESLDSARGGAAPTGGWSEFVSSLPEDRRPTIRGQLGVFEIPQEDPDSIVRTEITLHQMRNFLRSPLQGSAQFFLGMRDEVFDDPLDITDELIETESDELFFLLRGVFGQYLAQPSKGGESLAKLYDDETRRRELRGEIPTGLFRAAEREKHLRLLGMWRSNLSELGVDRSQPMRAVTFGGRLDSAVETLQSPSLSLTVPVNGKEVAVRLTGRTGPFDHTGTSVQLIASKLDYLQKQDEARFFRGFLDLLWLAASETLVLPSWRVALVTTGRGNRGRHVRQFRWPDPSVARSYLTGLASEMLSGMHDYRFPMKGAWYWKLSNWKPYHEMLAIYARQNYRRYESFWGPVREPERYGPPHNPEELFANRFGVYFEHQETGR